VTAEAVLLRLPPQATIRDAVQLRTLLLEHLEEAAPVELDASAVERIDTAVLQLLAAFLRDRRARQRAVVWRTCSEAVTRAARTLGLQDALGLTH
jgi:anti-anti-sigma regulatory factor